MPKIEIKRQDNGWVDFIIDGRKEYCGHNIPDHFWIEVLKRFAPFVEVVETTVPDEDC